MVGSVRDVLSTGIGETPGNQARGVSAILLLNQAAVQAIIVLSVHATPSALRGSKNKPSRRLTKGILDRFLVFGAAALAALSWLAGAPRFPVDAL